MIRVKGKVVGMSEMGPGRVETLAVFSVWRAPLGRILPLLSVGLAGEGSNLRRRGAYALIAAGASSPDVRRAGFGPPREHARAPSG